jgi:hypothetical protein
MDGSGSPPYQQLIDGTLLEITFTDVELRNATQPGAVGLADSAMTETMLSPVDKLNLSTRLCHLQLFLRLVRHGNFRRPYVLDLCR